MIVLLNPVFNCSKILLSFSADKVTTGTYNFVSAIVNVAFVGAAIAGLYPYASVVKTQFLDQVKIIFISKFTSGIFEFLQKPP